MAESEMIERVARGMAEENGGLWDEMSEDPYAPYDGSRGFFRRLARAAIEAMREPTEEMRQDGRGEYLRMPKALWSVAHSYRAMIDAALSPSTKD